MTESNLMPKSIRTQIDTIADGAIFNFKCNRFIPYKQLLKTFYSFAKILLCA